MARMRRAGRTESVQVGYDYRFVVHSHNARPRDTQSGVVAVILVATGRDRFA